MILRRGFLRDLKWIFDWVLLYVFRFPAYSQFTLPTFWWKTIEETPGYKPQHHLTTSRTLKNTYVLPVHGRELEYNPVMPCGSANNFVGQTSECFLNLHIASYSCWPLSALSNGQKKKNHPVAMKFGQISWYYTIKPWGFWQTHLGKFWTVFFVSISDQTFFRTFFLQLPGKGCTNLKGNKCRPAGMMSMLRHR